jgi:UPF0271 protein
MIVDLNCDLGEGGGFDAELLRIATSANVCCGAHAGDEAGIRETLHMANDLGVVVGAHPGYPDREHFGRRNLDFGTVEVLDLVARQVMQLIAWADHVGTAVRYLKPHGALYNQACADERLASPIAVAAEQFGLPVLALPNSRLEEACRGRVPFVREGFADRRYRADGSLVPRDEQGAIVTEIAEAVEQAKRLVSELGVRSLCVHGDHPEAVAFAREVRRALEADGVTLRPFVV